MTSAKLLTKRLPNGLIVSGRYEITGYIGAGGFAAVYEGRQLNIERKVAIKVLNLFSGGAQSGDTKNRAKERFVREAKAMAAIQHPAVVNVHDFGFIDEPYQPFIVMELLEGRTLEDELAANGGMDPSRALPMVCATLEALGEGHQKDIVHRDLKPSNLFVVDPGTQAEGMRLLDYGIATISQSKDDRLTTSGQIIGTYRYLPPEYIKGREIPPALDVYQMGLILVEMLTGKALVEGGNHFATLMVHVEGRLEIPKPLLDCELGPVLATALQPDFKRRFKDGYAFRDALLALPVDRIPNVAAHDGPVGRLSEVTASPRTVVSEPVSVNTSGLSVSTNFTTASAPRNIALPKNLDEALKKHAKTKSIDANNLPERPSTPTRQPTPAGPRPMTPPAMPAVTPPPHTSGGSNKAAIAVVVVGALILLIGIGGVVAYQALSSPKPAAAKNEKTVKLVTVPEGGLLMKDRTLLGPAPMDFRFQSPDDPPMVIEIKLAGHETQTITLTPASDAMVEVKLTKSDAGP